MKKLYHGILAIVAGAVLLMGLWGCGSSTGTTPDPGAEAASAAVTIRWPESTSRLIPVAAQSIKLVLSDTTGFSTNRIVDRPATGNTSTVNFTNIPVGLLTVTATAYPQAGAAGTPQAAGTSSLTTVAGQQASITLTMLSTIDHLDITSASLTVPTQGTLQLTATPKDAAGNTVLVAAGNITWASGAPGTASVNSATGLVTGVSAGSAVITATESDSQKSKSVTVTVTANNGPKLTLSLDAGLNGGGTVKVNSITKAELLSTAGAVVATATINAGSAQFELTGLTAGTYFIRVNDLADDLVPTKLDSTTASVTQFVGNTLVNSIIGTLASPNYQIKTFSKGQSRHTVAKYSNGTMATPERYSYVLLSLKTTPKKAEARVMGTGALLTSHSPGEHSFPSWIVGSTGHGTKNISNCTGCHGNLDSHPANHANINESNGFCYKCHYGKAGTVNGMVDAAQ